MTAAALTILFCLGRAHAQETETYLLRQAVSNRETVVYTRVIEFDRQKRLFHVRDYYETGRLQMDAFYSSFDKRVKEDYQCNYRSNTKEGPYTEWYPNGRTRFTGHFNRGLLNGAATAFYESGQKEAERRFGPGNRPEEAVPDPGSPIRCTGDESSRSSCSPRSAPSISGGQPMTGSRTSIHWQVYPGQEIYDWLLQHDRRSRK